MLEVIQNTRINSDASEDDLKPGEYRDAENISLIANELGAFSKGTTYGNIDSGIVFNHLNPDAICLGSAIDTAGTRSIVTFYQKIPIPQTVEYDAIIAFALSRGMKVPSAPVQAAQNLLVTLLKRDGIWAGLDCFFNCYGDGDQDFAKINWKNPTVAGMMTNHGMEYRTNFGFKGDGTAWIDTGFLASTALKYQTNNCSFTIGYEEIIQSPVFMDGVQTGAGWASAAPYPAPNTVQFAINSATDLPNIVSPQISGSEGIYFYSRSALGFQAVRQDRGDSLVTAIISTGRPNLTFFLGAINNNGNPSNFNTNTYGFFAAGEALNTLDREANFFYDWEIYKSTFTNDLVDQLFIQEVLMYLLEDQEPKSVNPLVRSSLMRVRENSYLDGYSFVNELFFFNFRQSAPKVINITRATVSPGFYDELSETSITVIKPHPPYAPVATRAASGGGVLNPPIQKKAFQFMCLYRFVDGEQSTKSPASEYLNSLDDVATVNSDFDFINIVITIPEKDYFIVRDIELFVRNTNNIGDWRSVTLLPKKDFVISGVNYQVIHQFKDDAIGGFLPLDIATKINDSIPQKSNYLAFIENRLFLIDSLFDYNFVSTFQIQITLDNNSATKLPDDRTAPGPLYGLAEFEYDSEYTVGIAFYDEFGRKYPSSINDRRFTTPLFVPVLLPAADSLPDQSASGTLAGLLNKSKITAKYDLRAAGNATFYGKPPSWAYWWGMIRTKNTKWEFQQSIQCLLRFPYSITKWGDTDPSKFPNVNLFLEDGYLYWDVDKLLALTGNNLTRTMSNEYIDVVIPANFPYPLDKEILIDFMMEVTTDVNAQRTTIVNREVVETFANKIRIRGDRTARWFSNDPAGFGQYFGFPKYVTGVNLIAGQHLRRDESTFPLVIKRRRQTNLDNIILYDTPQIYPIPGGGSLFSTFQPGQSISVARVDFAPSSILPQVAKVLNQRDSLVQPIFLEPTTVAINHSIKILWGTNVGDSLRLKIEVSLWTLTDLKQPDQKIDFARIGSDGKPYYVKNGEVAEYSIAPRRELTTGWYGYGITILDAQASAIQFQNNLFDLSPVSPNYAWKQSNEGGSALDWIWGSSAGNNYVSVQAAAIGAGFSKTIYQLLQAFKEDLTIAIEVEGTGFQGPPLGGAIIQYPGDTVGAPTNNANESLVNGSRYIVPYFINCAAPQRVVTLNNVVFTKKSISPADCFAGAEIWRLDQTTKRPISVISGSEGSYVALPTSIPGAPIVLSFGATKVINTSGWYGIAISFRGPTFAQFANSDYGQGANSWITTGNNPQWIFQPTQGSPPIYNENVQINPSVGNSIGPRPLNTSLNMMVPLFFPTGTDPAGYDNIRLLINWGNNNENGWTGKNITVAIWALDQGTLKPLAEAPDYTNVVPIGTGAAELQFITNTKLVGNKYYGVGLRNPTGHPQPNFTQFTNPGFVNDLSGWTTFEGNSGPWFNNSAESAEVDGMSDGAGYWDSGRIGQVLATARYSQVFIPKWSLTSNPLTSLFVELTVNGVVKQVITLDHTLLSGNALFDSVSVPAGGYIAVRFYGNGAPDTNYDLQIFGVYDSFNPYLFSSPMVEKFEVSNANNESWINWGAPTFQTKQNLPRDAGWKEGYTYWASSAQGQIGSTLRIDDTSVDANNIVLNVTTAGPSSVTNFIYGYLGMQEAPGINFKLFIHLSVFGPQSPAPILQIWVFNNPADIIGSGVVLESYPMPGAVGGGFATIDNSHDVVIPGGYKYIGYRVLGNGANYSLWLRDYYFVPYANNGVNAWTKDERIGTSIRNTLGLGVRARQFVSAGGTIIANFHADGITPSAISGRIGQDQLFGGLVKANIELFSGAVSNNYHLIVTDTNGTELGRTAVSGQALNVNPEISVQLVNPPSTSGLYLSIQNMNSAGAANNISARIRAITNTNLPVNIGAQSPAVANGAGTWVRDSSGNLNQLATTSFTWANGTDTIAQNANPLTVVLADAAGKEISAPQTFDPSLGKQTLQFAPTLAVDNNFNYGVKVKNNPANIQTSGQFKIHSISNIARNDGVANIITETINQPFYEAWINPLGSGWARSGYVSNFIAVVSDLIMSAFTPVAINPDSYHLCANIVQVGIEGHSTTYATPSTLYNYGIPFPSISSDPDAAGIVYIEKTGQSIGDINLRILDLGEKSQSNIVRWSDPIIVGTRTNNTNAFSDGNKYAIDFQRGAVQVMLAMHDHTLFCVHTQGMTSLYVSRATLTSPGEVEAGDELVLTNKVVGNDNKLTSNLGTVNPESVKAVESGTIAYGFDLIRKSFWQKTNNGIRNLTYECNAKKFFERICYYRLLAYNDGEDVKIYAGYNEKQKTFFLSFAEFRYRGETYPAVTVAYNAYIDGFLSRYSFEPMSYLATEQTVHTVKARSLNNPDFFGDFAFWLQDSSTSDYAWILKYGQWNDSGYWDDEENWKDDLV